MEAALTTCCAASYLRLRPPLPEAHSWASRRTGEPLPGCVAVRGMGLRAGPCDVVKARADAILRAFRVRLAPHFHRTNFLGVVAVLRVHRFPRHLWRSPWCGTLPMLISP